MIASPNNSVCILNNTLKPGGAEKNCVIICNELVKNGAAVELWITRLEKTPLIDLLDKRVKIISIPGKKIRYTFLHLKDQMLNCNSKTLLIFNVELLVPAFFINKIYRLNFKIVARSISTLSLAYNQQGFFGRKVWLKLIKYAYNRIESIIAQSSGMKEDLIINLKIDSSKIRVIPNPAYNFSNNSLQYQENNKSNFKEILFVGRLTHAKGLSYLLKAFKLALESSSDIHLTIVGTGELKDEVQNSIIEMGLSDKVNLEGYQTNTIPYYKKAKATVLTSVREGFPNVLVESISVGTPVISFDCPSGPKDIIIQNINGILVEHFNITDFAEAILNVVNDKIKFDKQIVMQTCERFNLEKIIGDYEKVLFQN